MGIIAWIAVGLTAGLLANMPLPGKGPRGLISICLTCFTGQSGRPGGFTRRWDIQLPDTMKRAMARQAEAEREKRAKIITAEGESLAAAALGQASDIMMAHPLAVQLRNLQSLVEIGVDKNTTVVFPAPLMTTIAELGSFLAREQAAASPPPLTTAGPIPPPLTAAGPISPPAATANGAAMS
jgi:hypothetical protein